MDFIGRTSELATLNAELERGSGFVVNLRQAARWKNNADQRVYQRQTRILLFGNHRK